MDGGKENHLLNLKVMRLSKPNIPISNPVLCEKEDLAYESLNTPSIGIPNGGGGDSSGGLIEGLGMTPMLMLQSGVIYLGEIFSSYISLNNHSPFEVRNVFIKVELQTTSQRISLLDSEQQPVDSFGPGFSSDFVVQREVKESGVNILVCSVNYNTLEGENKKFRKFFKFQVMNPLVLKTRVHNLPNFIFLEACLENATQGSLFIESMQFEPTEQFTFVDISGGVEENQDDRIEKENEFQKLLKQSLLTQSTGQSSLPNILSLIKVSSDVVFLKQGNSRQYLFKIIPINPNDSETKNSVSLGRLDITWRSYFGEIGRLKTAPIQRKLNHDEIECIVTNIPNRVKLEKPFKVNLRLTNKSQRFLTPQFILVRNKIDGITINGHLPKIDIIQPQTSTDFEIELFPLKPGMQQIVGLAIRINDPPPTTGNQQQQQQINQPVPVPIKPVINTSNIPRISTISTSSTSSTIQSHSPSSSGSSQFKNFYELGVLADIFVEIDE